MNRLRETLNPEEEAFAMKGPTRYKTGKNQYALHCAECGTLYYVDEETHRKAVAALEGDPSEISFICPECEELFDEEAHAH